MAQKSLFPKKLPFKDDKDPIFVIDGSSFVYRAYYAIRGHLSNRKGLPTKAVFGFTQMLLKLLREMNPEYVVVCFDAKGPTFRHEMYKEYKANRPPMPDDLSVQIPYIKEVTRAFGVPILEIEGFEADDLIAAIATRMERPIVIVGGDKDLFPLISEKVVMWDPMKDELIDESWIKKRFGIEPKKLLDVRALAGDSIDNVPGVPGIGEKTALRLIKEYGSLEEVLNHAEEIKQKRLRENLIKHAGDALISKKLVELEAKAPIPLEPDFYRKRPLNALKLRELFLELEFKKLLKELPATKTLSYDQYELVLDPDKVKEIVEKAKGAEVVAIDLESDTKDPMRGKIVGVSLCFNPPKAYYFPFRHEGLEAQKQLPWEAFTHLASLIEDPSVKKIGHNIKYDLIILARYGVTLKGLEGDTMLASYLLDPTRRTHGLDELAEEVLGHTMISYKEVTKELAKGESFARVPLEKAKVYACEDAHVTYLLYQYFWPKLKEESLWKVFTEIDRPLIEVLAHMEMVGIKIDTAYLRGLSREMAEKLKELEEKIYTLAGEKFNINSSKQLGQILFEKLKLPTVKKTPKKTAYSTDNEVLEELSAVHELPRLILEYRTLAKLKSTYVDALPKMVNPETGRLHTSFNQTVTATGRLSSSDPNLQNIPVRGEEGLKIRQAFVPEEGFLFLSADYSQIDLRVLAHYSGDETLIKAFWQGEDIHRRTAAEIFGIPPEEVTPEMRRMAKTINFGIVYGMSPYGLAKELKIGRREAKAFIERYFERYPGVKRYMEQIVAEAREKGYVETLFGRKRPLPDINSPNRTAREFAERTAINTPIQGTAADIIKLAMIKIHRIFKEKGFGTRMLLQVHDELLFEVPEKEIEEIQPIVRQIMEGVVELKVPLKVNLAIGKNWAEAKA
ncbi:DNA polymerase I [Thermodesulfatator indicus DSM 15286]|uniref:DNA polymerase I n=1 Tax=Thermodesulfatator indicus (strain DSM 15286 / JCM 11887 / CIR29812) TaxID=667014 RepID=F8ABH8_THEID|nr:DNA polymerase I [Thermodesulfatator indicus]AEH45575.1 DNA polymerase I [Thermodesulfatator indicus DSM 15286]